MMQSERMEAELQVMRDLFREVSMGDETDPSKMVSISRVILQQEREIARQKLVEGRTVEREALISFRDELMKVFTDTAREFLPGETYNAFVDALLPRLQKVGVAQ
jgi:hypothetical protein